MVQIVPVLSSLWRKHATPDIHWSLTHSSRLTELPGVTSVHFFVLVLVVLERNRIFQLVCFGPEDFFGKTYFFMSFALSARFELTLPLINPRLHLVVRVLGLDEILPQAGRNGQLIIHQSPVFHQILSQQLRVQDLLLIQKEVLQVGQQVRLALNFPCELLNFLNIHSPLVLEVPLLQELNHPVLVLVQHENGDISLFLLVLQLILLSSESLDFPLFFVKKPFVDLSFELKLVFVVERIELEEALWEILNALYFVDGVIVLGLGGLEGLMDMGVSVEELGLAVDFVGNVLYNLGVFGDLEILLFFLVVEDLCVLHSLVLVFVLDQKNGPVSWMELRGVLVLPDSFFSIALFGGGLWIPLFVFLGGDSLELVGVDQFLGVLIVLLPNLLF